jgi:dTDP-4-dehydrorhamnose 3,5-epimerase
MSLELIEEHLDGIKIFKPRIFYDERGCFYESFRRDELYKLGIIDEFVQDNNSISKKNVIRGMHFQWDKPQGKLIRVVRGGAIFREIDIRLDSPNFGKHAEIELSDKNSLIMWIPPGFANGFASLEDDTIVNYKCTSYWNPKGEACISWNDPQANIDWRINSPIVSEKDGQGLTIEEWSSSPMSQVFKYKR